jgi:hypothetical protein
MNLKIKGHKVQLNGNQITGDTYPIKSYIKDYLCGKWSGENKSWIVDLGQVEKFMNAQYPSIVVDTDTNTTEATGAANTSRWYTNTRYGRELSEDY